MSIEVCGNQRDIEESDDKRDSAKRGHPAREICLEQSGHKGKCTFTPFELPAAEKNQPRVLTGSQQASAGKWTREDYLREFTKLTDSMVALTKRKNADYAGDSDPFRNFREFGTMGFLVRMSDKWSRIKNLVGGDKAPQVKDETVEDTLLDLATYSLLLICWLRSGPPTPLGTMR